MARYFLLLTQVTIVFCIQPFFTLFACFLFRRLFDYFFKNGGQEILYLNGVLLLFVFENCGVKKTISAPPNPSSISTDKAESKLRIRLRDLLIAPFDAFPPNRAPIALGPLGALSAFAADARLFLQAACERFLTRPPSHY